MGTSYGLIEVSGVVAAVDSLDAMCKAADVSFVTWERKLGGRLITIIVEGNVSAAKAAIEAAENICKVNNHILATKGLIASPTDEIRKMVQLSQSRLIKKAQQKEKNDTGLEEKKKEVKTTKKSTSKQNSKKSVQTNKSTQTKKANQKKNTTK